MQKALAAIAIGVVVLTACAPKDPPAGAGGSSSAGEAEQRYSATALVLEDESHGPMLCLGGVRDSLPPQCGNVSITNWDWSRVAGEEHLGGTTWGAYEVEGTYDGTSFAVLRASPTDEGRPGDGEDITIETPCPEPEGGWLSNGSPRDSPREAIRAAEAEPDFSGAWVGPMEEPNLENPGATHVVLNVAFTGDTPRHEAELHELWGGPLCVTKHERTYRELLRIQRQLTPEGGEELGLQVLTSEIDVVDNEVELGVVTIDESQETALDRRYGEGAVRVWAALQPVGRPSDPSRAGDPSPSAARVELDCSPGDPQPDVISDGVERPDAPATPKEALQRYLDIHDFDVDAERFDRAEGASRPGVEIWTLEAGGGTKAIADVVEGRLPGWGVSSFRACLSWEQANRLDG